MAHEGRFSVEDGAGDGVIEGPERATRTGVARDSDDVLEPRRREVGPARGERFLGEAVGVYSEVLA